MEHRSSGHDGCALVVSNDLAAAEAFAGTWAPGPVFTQTIRTTPVMVRAGRELGGRPRLDLIGVCTDEVRGLARAWSFEQPPVLVVWRPVTVLDITQPSQSDVLARLRPLGLPIMVAVGGVGYDERHDEWFLCRGVGFGSTTWGAARGALVVHLAERITATRAAGDDTPTRGPAAEVQWGRVLCAPAELCREALDLVAMGGVR